MRRSIFTAKALLLAAALGGCSTQIEVQVPQSDIENFAKCMENPTTSYQRPPGPATFDSLGYSISNVRGLAGGTNHLFVTNAQLNGKAAPPTGQWTPEAKVAFTTTKDAASPTPDRGAALTALADEVDGVWNHPVHQTLLTAYNELARTDRPPQNLPAISDSDLRDYLKMVRSVTEKNGWSIYALRSAQHLTALEQTSGDAAELQRQLAAQKFVGGIFVATYLQAYFRNGQFVQLRYDFGNPLQDLEKVARNSAANDKETIDKILNAIRKVDPNAMAELDAIINKEITGTIGKVATAGLITRGGDSLAMPAVSVSLDVTKPKPVTVTKVDANAILEDVVRVTFEALFDSINEVPAVSNATGVRGLPTDYAAVELPDFAKVTSAYVGGNKPSMTADDFAKVDSEGAKVHALTTSAVANLIRGVNVAALNNESIANTLTSMAATTARKVTERVTWCYYAVVDATTPTAATALYSHPLGQRTITFDLKY